MAENLYAPKTIVDKKLLADLIRELEAADLIIEQFEAARKAARRERSFTIRTGKRRDLIAFAKEEAVHG